MYNMNIFCCRLLRNFEHCEGGLLLVNDIFSDAEQVKENFSRPPNGFVFGLQLL